MTSKWLDKHWKAIISTFVLTIVILTMLLIHLDASRNIDNQIDSLYEKVNLVEQDFSNLYGLSGVTCYINEKTNVIIFNESDCSLKVTYSKDGELISKSFEDARIGKNFNTAIFAVLLVVIFASIASAIILVILISVLETREKAKIKSKKQVIKGELEKSQGIY